jgi:sec-independent protein translocase protein TatA
MKLGFMEIAIIVGLLLLLFGPSRLPNLGRSIGESIRGFKKGITEDDSIDVTETAKQEKIRQSESANANKQSAKEKTKV